MKNSPHNMKKIFLLLLFLSPWFSYAQLPITGLVAWYPFCGNTNDYSGNGHNMLNSRAILTTDRFGSTNCAYEFNGANSVIYYSTFFPVGSDLTYACWIYPYTTQNPSILYNGNTNTDGIGLIMSNGTGGGTGNDVDLLLGGVSQDFAVAVTLNQWHHLVLRKTGSTFELIIDTVSSGTFTGAFNSPTGEFSLGLDYTNGTNAFYGKIDDAAIYNRAISDAEVKQLYHFDPDISFSLGNDTSFCTGSITLSSLPVYVAGAYLWSTGSTDTSITVSATGSYSLTISKPYSCSFSDTINVNSNTIPVDLGPDTAICLHGSITLSSPITPARVSYFWSTHATSSSIVISTPGTYWVQVSDETCAGSDTINISLLPAPLVYLGNDTTICAGAVLPLQSLYNYSGVIYEWSTGQNTPSINVANSGTYWLDVSQYGCTSADSITVSFDPLPTIALGNDTSICAGDVYTLVAGEPKGAIYLWNNGSSDSAITVTDSGTYILTVTINGCSSTDTISIGQITKPAVNFGNDTTLCKGDSITLASNAAPAIWSTGSAAQSITVTEAGIYWVAETNQCGTTTDTIKIDVDACNIWFPSAFTPDGDGHNDIIRVVGSLQFYRDFSLSIFNRWGERIFYTTDIYQGWDGKLKGIPQDVGTYFYMINYTLEGKKHFMKGDIELIR